MTDAPLLLILMAGMPGSGKSTIARHLGGELQMPVIDKDVILSALLETGVPEALAQSSSYRAMFALAETLLGQQRSVILDSPAALPETVSAAKEISHRSAACHVTILCSAEREVRNERVGNRVALPSQPVGVSETPGTARERFIHLPGDTIEVDTMTPLHVATRETVDAVKSRMLSLTGREGHGS